MVVIQGEGNQQEKVVNVELLEHEWGKKKPTLSEVQKDIDENE